MSRVLISVVVCTFNRSSLLEICLQSLANQTLDKNEYEVVIVDNNSTDRTQEVAEKFILVNKYFKVIKEKKQGLSHARNKGYREARGEYVAYIDDDAKASLDWCEKIKIFFETYPHVKVVGGPYRAYTLSPPPAWFPPDYGTLTLGNITRPLADGEWFSGTNMIFAKEVLLELGGFNIKLGMQGQRISYGEETNCLIRLRQKHYLIYFCPEIIVDHAILNYKFSLSWLLKSSYEGGCSSRETFSRTGTKLKDFLMLCFVFVKGLLKFIFLREKHLKRKVYHSFHYFYWHLGYFIRNFKNNLNH